MPIVFADPVFCAGAAASTSRAVRTGAAPGGEPGVPAGAPPGRAPGVQPDSPPGQLHLSVHLRTGAAAGS